MKLFPFVALLFLVGVTAWGQSVFRIDSIPQQGVVVDKACKWHAGDNPRWAKPDFDDARWDTLNPTQNVLALDKLPQQGIGWLRIHLHIAPRLRGQWVGIAIQQAGATEFFSNGKLVLRYGKIGSRKNIEVSGLSNEYTSQSIQLEADSVQVIAIRYAFLRDKLPINRFNSLFLSLSIKPIDVVEKTESHIRLFVIVEAVLFGVFLVLGLLQLLLYAVSREQRAALFVGLFLVTQSIVHCLNLVRNAFDIFFPLVGITHGPVIIEAVYIGFIIALTISSFYYLRGIYQYFDQPRKIPYRIIAGLTFLTIPAALFLNSPYNFLAQFILGNLVPFSEILRIGILAIRRKRPGANLFTLAHSLVLLIFIIWLISVFLPTISRFLTENAIYLFSISFLGPALVISLLLAQERAATNALLYQQLLDLDVLSQKTIAQEQEKQQLLANQNERLEQQVQARTAELKASQTQLIQKEKLASLGELTAGIAHEIQNPLNFVNNFSEVSTELVDELEEELDKGETEEVKAIAGDLRQNLQKIHHHGVRASSIIKGMLEHSRTESGEKRATDLNALADEYLKIAYHGVKAKYKNFTCELITDFDPELEPVEVAPQEIGRVLLNLYNNAFYAVSERARQHNDSTYKPTVEVHTKHELNQVIIQVRDNGTGIPKSVKSKIFQPFFTTKPTGEGTGLGLSLSYDIITKGYGGTLRVESQTGEGSTFIIELPQRQKSDSFA